MADIESRVRCQLFLIALRLCDVTRGHATFRRQTIYYPIMQNKEIRLASRPAGMPTVDNFQIQDATMPQPQEGEVLVRTQYISVDPYLRGRMREGKSYIAPFEVGQVIQSGAVGEVMESKAPNFQTGDIVVGGALSWSLYATAKGTSLQKVNPNLAPVSTALGVLGMPGLTGYFGLLDIGHPRAGETVVVSGAAGAVGMVVCQIAKIKGCRVVAIAGGQDKTTYLLNELGVDAAINYKTANGYKKVNDLRQELGAACPKGVDIYFDNVGGDISDAVMTLIAPGARIPICGQISVYNLEKPDVGLRPQPYLLVSSASMKGFIITQYMSEFGKGIAEMAQWLTEGKLKFTETVVEGFENTPRAFIGLFKGENLGKQIVKI